MKLRDKATFCGVLDYTVKRINKNGQVEIIEHVHDQNMIINKGLEDITKILGLDLAGITKIGVGTNGTVESPSDMVLTNSFTKTLDGHTYPNTTSIEYEFTILTSEANGKAIREFGLLCADNTLFARKTRATAINKESDIEINGFWTLTFSRDE